MELGGEGNSHLNVEDLTYRDIIDLGFLHQLPVAVQVQVFFLFVAVCRCQVSNQGPAETEPINLPPRLSSILISSQKHPLKKILQPAPDSLLFFRNIKKEYNVWTKVRLSHLAVLLLLYLNILIAQTVTDARFMGFPRPV